MARKGISKQRLANAHLQLEVRLQHEIARHEKFRELVRKTRETQRLYFQTKSPQVLREAKQLEKAVDDELDGKPQRKPQPGLFDQPG